MLKYVNIKLKLIPVYLQIKSLLRNNICWCFVYLFLIHYDFLFLFMQMNSEQKQQRVS